jgi:TrpR-related protein YerC/YecD
MRKENLNTKEINQLSKAILSLETADETRNFLRDIMTIQELETIASRLEAAKLLYSTEKSYRMISKDTGLSTTTVTRVADWLNRGMDGYMTVLGRMFNKENATGNTTKNESHHSKTQPKTVL